MGTKDFKRHAELLMKAREGDDAAFREIYMETYRSQLFHLRMHLKDPEEVKDALQEVYFLLYQNMDKISPPSVLLAYLNRLSYFVGKNMAKKLYRQHAHLTDSDRMEYVEEPKAQELLCQIENTEQLNLVQSVIEKLPETERSIIYMRYYQKLTQQEVAISLGLSRSGVRYLLNNAHAHMRELLKEQGFEGLGVFLPLYLKNLTLPKPLRKKKEASEMNPALVASPGPGVSTGLCAICAFAVLVGGGALMSRTSITSLKVSEPYVKAPAKIEVQVRSSYPVKDITAKSEGAKSVRCVQTAPDSYSVYVKENGNYKVTVTDNSGRGVSDTIEVSCIDNVRPQASVSIGNDRLHVSAVDNESGIDFDNLYCDGDGLDKLLPTQTDPVSGEAVFDLPQKNVVLHLRDLAGNKSKIPIFCEEE